MCENLKALIAKCWKDELLDLSPGRHTFDEVVTIRVTGTVDKQADQLVAPTASLPLIPILALFWEKAGVTRDRALAILREAITEAMAEKANKGERIEARIRDVETAVQAVKDDLIAKLPKTKRAGRLITKDLRIEVMAVHEEQETLVPAA